MVFEEGREEELIGGIENRRDVWWVMEGLVGEREVREGCGMGVLKCESIIVGKMEGVGGKGVGFGIRKRIVNRERDMG